MKAFFSFVDGRLILGTICSLLMVGCQKVDVSNLPEQKSLVDGAGGPEEGSHPPMIKNTSTVLKPVTSKIDLLLVIDDSASMRADSLTLAAKLEGFVQKLESFSLDWQICLTSTNINKFGGASLIWSGTNSPVLKKGAVNVSQTFISTVENLIFGENDSGDERGIAAMSLHLDQRNSNGCYRSGAALSTIVISDEDERSVGGVEALSSKSYRPLEPLDLPENYVNQVQSLLGSQTSQVALSSHSIITVPGDEACLKEQNAQGYSSFEGTIYQKLSQLTGGSVASICSRDYSATLSVFASQIQKSLQRVRLDCIPKEDFKITTMPTISLNSSMDGQHLVIESQIDQDVLVNIQYTCQ